VILLIAGFPCKTVSSLNPYHATDDNRSTIASGQGVTGECWCAIEAYIVTYYPDCIVLENVKGLLDNGMATDVRNRLAKLGYFCRFYILNAQQFHLPQDRARIYFCAVRAKTVPHLDKSAAIKMMDETMNILQTDNEMIPIETLLLPEDHPMILTYLEQCLQADRDRAITQHHKYLRTKVEKGRVYV